MNKLTVSIRAVFSGSVIAAFIFLNIACSGELDRENLLDGNFGDIDTNPPELIAPLDEIKVTHLTANLSWSAKIEASYYTVEIARDPDFSQAMAGSPFTTEATNLSVTFEDAYTYFWRVRANTTEEGKYSQVWRIHVLDDALWVYCPAEETDCSNEDKIGNKSFPYQVISKSIVEAKAKNLELRVVSRGNSVAYNETIELTSGVVLKGGYQKDWSREIDNHDTIIENSQSIVVKAFDIYGSGETLFEGFTVQSNCNSENCYALQIEYTDESLTVSNNIIRAGAGSDSYGVELKYSNATILDNDIHGGTGSTYSYGISSSYSSPFIIANVIDGGISTNTNGIKNTYSHPLIYANQIKGGDSTSISRGIFNGTLSSPIVIQNIVDGGSAGSGTNRSYGIDLSYTYIGSTIFSNQIFGGSAQTTYGINGSSDKTSFISNNSINGGTATAYSYGIYMDSSTDDETIWNNIVFTSGATEQYCVSNGSNYPIAFQNNNLFSCSTALYRDYYKGDLAFICSDGKPGSTSGCSTGENIADTTSGNITFSNSGGQLFRDIDGADDDITTSYDNDCSLRTTASGVLNSALSCSVGLEKKAMLLSKGSSQDECNSDHPLLNVQYSENIGICSSFSYSNKTDCESNSYVWNTYCYLEYLAPAAEVFADNIGNDNGLCEAGETCFINPNMGAYAGHGSLVDSGCDVSALINNVTLLKYEQNGY